MEVDCILQLEAPLMNLIIHRFAFGTALVRIGEQYRCKFGRFYSCLPVVIIDVFRHFN